MIWLLYIIFPLLIAVFLPSLILKFHPKQDSENLPIGSMGWPLFGKTIAFIKPHRSTSIRTFLQEHCFRYERVFKSHLFGGPTIVSCDYELNIFVILNEEKLFQATIPSQCSAFSENSLSWSCLETFTRN